MSIKEALGFGPHQKVRYAIVGLGNIAQEDMMPGVDHTGNSVITALVTSDPKKAQELSAKYEVDATFTYEEFPRALASGRFDAIYVATPNWRHAEFVVPVLQAGIHVLCEKPNIGRGARPEKKTFKNTDHFGGEVKYFSDCILKGTNPEPDGEEGYADVRVLEGILAALKSGGAV